MGFSKFYERSFARFMDGLHRKGFLEKPKIKREDIESFFVHVTELKSRVEELEKEISIHAFNHSGVCKHIHPHNKELLHRCRISESEAYGIYGDFMRERELNRSEDMRRTVTV